MLKKDRELKILAAQVARRFHVRLYFLQNVGNHLHLGVQVRRRESFQNFLRVLTQKISFLITGARKGNPQGKFWGQLAFSRVVEWGRDWAGLELYRQKNLLEASGVPRILVDYLWREGQFF